MIKTTLFVAAAFAVSIAASAQVISFETSESYTTGSINGQNNWSVTQYEDETFVENQVISTDLFSEGAQSLKLTKEPSVSVQVNPIIGAFYTYPQAIANDNATFSADIYISERNSLSMSVLFGLVDVVENKYRTYINFAYDGLANVLVKGQNPGTLAIANTAFAWTPLTWYNVKIQTIGETVKFFIDGVEIYEGELASNGAISQVRFIHDNYNGFAYVDNFRTNAEVLSTNNFTSNVDFKHFFNQQNQTLTLNSTDASLTNIEVYNTLGQNVLTQKLSFQTETISLSDLASGAYIVKVAVGSVVKTIKIVKN